MILRSRGPGGFLAPYVRRYVADYTACSMLLPAWQRRGAGRRTNVNLGTRPTITVSLSATADEKPSCEQQSYMASELEFGLRVFESNSSDDQLEAETRATTGLPVIGACPLSTRLVVPRVRAAADRRRQKYGRRVQVGRRTRHGNGNRTPSSIQRIAKRTADHAAPHDVSVKGDTEMLYFTPLSPYRGSVSHQSLQAGSRTATSQDRAPILPSTANAQPRHATGNLRTRSSLFSRGLSSEVFSFVDNAVKQFENQKHVASSSLGIGASTLATRMALDLQEEDEPTAAEDMELKGSSDTRKQPSRTPLSENQQAGPGQRTSARILLKRAKDGVPAEHTIPAIQAEQQPSPARPPRAPVRSRPVAESQSDAKMKRERSAKSELAMKPPGKKVKQRGKNSDIQSPTSRTLLRMLRVGTGEATANNTSKEEAETHIRRLAGKYIPTETLGRRYAGRQALQELLTNYLGRSITFQQAAGCFENPHNRGLQATAMLHELLDGKCWPPYPENAVSEDSEVADGMEELEAPSFESHDNDEQQPPLDILRASDSHVPGFRLPAQSGHVEGRVPFGQTVTSGATVGSTDWSIEADEDDTQDPADLVNEFRAVITTGFSKTGTAFQTESDLESYARHAGVHTTKKLELKSFQLFTHCAGAPAALVTLRRPQAVVPSPAPAARLTSLTSLRCSDILTVPATQMPLMSRSGSFLRHALLTTNFS